VLGLYHYHILQEEGFFRLVVLDPIAAQIWIVSCLPETCNLAKLTPEVEYFLRKIVAPEGQEYLTTPYKIMMDIEVEEDTKLSAVFVMGAARLIMNGYYPHTMKMRNTAARIYLDLRNCYIEKAD
jgi:hypothetical protein